VRIIHLVPSVGVEEGLENNGVRVYPNPASGVAVVSIDESIDCSELRIRNTAGQLVRRLPVKGMRSLEIDVEELLQGVYILEFYRGESRVAVKKLLIGN
jgi:hypothetical protein